MGRPWGYLWSTPTTGGVALSVEIRHAPASTWATRCLRTLQGTGTDRATAVAQTMISASVGIKHQVDTRQADHERMAVAIQLLIA